MHPLQRVVLACGPWQRSSHTGQIYMHAPHLRHSSDVISKGVVIYLSVPRPAYPIAFATICSSHMRTHKPQSMQSSFNGSNLTCFSSSIAAMSCSFFELGQRAIRSSSIISLLLFTLLWW